MTENASDSQDQLEPRGDMSPGYRVKFYFLVALFFSAIVEANLITRLDRRDAPLHWMDIVNLTGVVLTPWAIGISCYFQMKRAVDNPKSGLNRLHELRMTAVTIVLAVSFLVNGLFFYLLSRAR